MTQKKVRIVVTGASGQLGKTFQRIGPAYPDHQFVFADRSQVDVGEASSVQKVMALQPDFIINCAAYTAVDKAETDKAEAKRINEDGARHMVEAAQKTGAVLIHFSSDYVYHIRKKGPLKETDPKKPHGIYAKTKWKADKIVSAYPKHVILRTSWVYARQGHNFVNTMLRLAESRNALTIVNDQWGSPTFTDDLAAAVMAIVAKLSATDNRRYYGSFNYSNEGLLSWLDFAQAIFDIKGLDVQLSPTTTQAYNAPAPRPHWSYMCKKKVKKTFGVEVPHWRDALMRCLSED